MKTNSKLANIIALTVIMVRLGLRQIFRQAILISMFEDLYLLGRLKLDNVNTLFGKFALNSRDV